MMRPHPPRLRMKRRNAMTATLAMGARTVAGEMATLPMVRVAGTGRSAAASRAGAPHELSQNFFTVLFYLPLQEKAPAAARAKFLTWFVQSLRKTLLLRGFGFGVLAAEALHAAGGVHQLLLAGKEGMAV